MPSDHGGAIFVDVSVGQREEPGRMQVSHQQAHHSAGNTWEKGLIYVAPTCQSTEHHGASPIARVGHGKIPTCLGRVLSRSPSDLAPTLRDRQVPIVALLVHTSTV
ncbi:hypothetical protein ACSS6W_010765 [Trichoderma asperelloides]